MKKVIVRIKGGLGNQLFCYAAARRLSIVNNCELVLDQYSGFVRDKVYKRNYQLHHFNIHSRFATPYEELRPFERGRRYLLKGVSNRRPYLLRKYIEQEGVNFDSRLLSRKVLSKVYLDGYWQSEKYFADIEDIIREDLKIIPPEDHLNRNIADLIQASNSVCLHVRWFDKPQVNEGSQFLNNVDTGYYSKAIDLIVRQIDNPHFFVFSDYPQETRELLGLLEKNVTFVNHNKEESHAFADLWLMSLCSHFIIANSSFSWWGAWLSNNRNKVVVAPSQIKNSVGHWGFDGLLPEKWLII